MNLLIEKRQEEFTYPERCENNGKASRRPANRTHAEEDENRKHNILIAEIYNTYLNDVKQYFTCCTHDEMQAEDMAQELFIKLMNYEDLILKETAKSFVFTIAKRMVVDYARHKVFVRRATQGYMLKMQEEKFWQDSDTLECRQISEMERNAIGRLPKKMARVYSLTRFDGKTSQELAEELNISKRTVEYHLLVSRKEIRKMLKKAINQ